MSMGSTSKVTDHKEIKEAKKTRRPALGPGRAGEGFFFVCMLALFASICGIIFAFTKAFFHSDSAFFVQLAVEQMKTGKLFPPGMCYSTVLFVRSPNLLLIPILTFVKDWILAREIMVIVMWIMLIAAIFYCFFPRGDRNIMAAVIFCMLMLNPYQTLDVANETTDMLFFQAAYVTIFFDIAMALGIVHRIILLRGSEKTAYKAFLMVFLAVVLFFPLLGSIRQDMNLTLPLVAAILVFYFLEQDQDAARVLRTKRCVFTVLLILAVVAAGFVCYRQLGKMYWSDGKGAYLKMDKYTGLWYSIGMFVNSLTVIFGNVEGAVFMSFPGLTKFINYWYALLIVFVIPTAALIRYKKHENRFTRFMILYTWISNLLVAGVFISCNQQASRYLLTIYFDDAMLFAVLLSEYMKKRGRLTALMAGLAVVAYCSICHLYFWGHYRDRIGENPNGELISFLEEHDLHYGYGSFWNASVNTVLSNGEVQVLPLWDYSAENGTRKAYNPSDFRDWLNNRNWYKAKDHPGKSFVLLRQYAEEDQKEREKWIEQNGDDPSNPWIDQTPPEEVLEEFYSLNPEELTCGDYRILVFEDNEELRKLGDTLLDEKKEKEKQELHPEL